MFNLGIGGTVSKSHQELIGGKEVRVIYDFILTEVSLPPMSAQHSVQRTAEGSGLLVWFGNVCIRFGWWLAKFGSR